MTFTLSLLDVHCPVLVLLAPIDVVDGDGSSVRDLDDIVKPLVVVEEGEELSIGDRIE